MKREKSLRQQFQGLDKSTDQVLQHRQQIICDFNQDLIADLIHGILVLSKQQEIIYINNLAQVILKKFNPNHQQKGRLPMEIWHLCQSLIVSRNLFPQQYWVLESRICLQDSIAVHVKVYWFHSVSLQTPHLLILMEDESQFFQYAALEEAQSYGLTSRETEIWLLQRAGYTYKQIAAELNITPNTVKKHIKSILVKQKKAPDIDEL